MVSTKTPLLKHDYRHQGTGHFQPPKFQCFHSAELMDTVPQAILRETQEGCGGLGAENAAAFPKAGPIFQQPFSLPESAQTLAGIAFRAAGKSGNNFPAASKFAGKPSSKEFWTATAFSSFLIFVAAGKVPGLAKECISTRLSCATACDVTL